MDLQEVATKCKFKNEELELDSLDVFTEDLQTAAKDAFDRIVGTNDHNHLIMTPIAGQDNVEHNIVLALYSSEKQFHSSVSSFEVVDFKKIPLVAMVQKRPLMKTSAKS
ncbi:hypothetical protein IV203_014693 [Nitzschia inconspicua]|uniref:Uncharacterized protein n=1 Tax=Nitzschia inconspicua TaxID=303405 RepID=A0A9K3PST5_9STRA|nr:hypothetical protein IV203_014693 [Nitzschia inconspicua]